MFRVTAYDRRLVNIADMPLAQARGIDMKAFDYRRARCLGKSGFCHPGTGAWVNYGELYRALGEIGEDILDVIQPNPGVYFSKLMLYIETGHEVLAGSDANTHIHRLRLGHGETKKTEHAILTKDGDVAWNPMVTWIHIAPVLAVPSLEHGYGNGNSQERVE